MYGQNQADLIEAMEYVLIKEKAEQIRVCNGDSTGECKIKR